MWIEKKKTFLVTGGTGFIGSHICELLIKKNYNVKIIDNNFRGRINKIKGIKKNIKFIKGDIRNRKVLDKALKNTDAVIHLAYVNGTKYFYSNTNTVFFKFLWSKDIIYGIINVLL